MFTQIRYWLRGERHELSSADTVTINLALLNYAEQMLKRAQVAQDGLSASTSDADYLATNIYIGAAVAEANAAKDLYNRLNRNVSHVSLPNVSAR